MKKNLITNDKNNSNPYENTHAVGSLDEIEICNKAQVISEKNKNSKNKKSKASKKLSSIPIDLSFSTIISLLFFAFLIVAVAYKIVFPTIDSYGANITHKKVGTSIVYNFINLLQNSKYEEALKLLDVNEPNYSVNALMNSLQQELGTTNIVDCNVLNVQDNKDYTIINTVVSYVNKGKLENQNQPFLIKSTPQGWKISLSGVIKKFNIDPVTATFGEDFSMTLEDIEYCIEGINLKVKVKNNKYSDILMKGNIKLSTSSGTYPLSVDTMLKSKVKYDHNFLFTGASGEPTELVIDLVGKGFSRCILPLKIKR